MQPGIDPHRVHCSDPRYITQFTKNHAETLPRGTEDRLEVLTDLIRSNEVANEP